MRGSWANRGDNYRFTAADTHTMRREARAFLGPDREIQERREPTVMPHFATYWAAVMHIYSAKTSHHASPRTDIRRDCHHYDYL